MACLVLLWCFCDSQWQGEGSVVRRESGCQNFNKMTKCVGEWIGACRNLQTHNYMTWRWDDSNHLDTHAQHDWLIVWSTSAMLVIDHWMIAMMLVRQCMWLCVWARWMFTYWRQHVHMKQRPCVWPEHGCKHNHWHQHENFICGMNKKGGYEGSHELTGWTWVHADIK